MGRLSLHAVSIEIFAGVLRMFNTIQPDERYHHLAAQSRVGYSFGDKFPALNPDINGTHYVLAAKMNPLHISPVPRTEYPSQFEPRKNEFGPVRPER